MFCPEGYLPLVTYFREIPRDIVFLFERMASENGGTNIENFIFYRSGEQFALCSPDLRIVRIEGRLLSSLYVDKSVVLEQRKLAVLTRKALPFPSRSPDPVHIMRLSDNTINMVAECDLDEVDSVLEEEYWDNFYTEIPLVFSRGTGIIDLSLIRWLEQVEGEMFSEYADLKRIAENFEGWSICVEDNIARREARASLWNEYRKDCNDGFKPSEDEEADDYLHGDDEPSLASDRFSVVQRSRRIGAPRDLRDRVVNAIREKYPEVKPTGHGAKKQARVEVCNYLGEVVQVDTFNRAWKEVWDQ